MNGILNIEEGGWLVDRIRLPKDLDLVFNQTSGWMGDLGIPPPRLLAIFIPSEHCPLSPLSLLEHSK